MFISKKNQRIQCRAARLDWNIRGADIVRRLRWQTVRERRDYFTTVLMYRCLKNESPFYLTTHFTTIQHNHRTRRSLSDVYVPRPNIELFNQSLLYQDPILWNGLSTDLKCSNNVMAFKRLYKQM